MERLSTRLRQTIHHYDLFLSEDQIVVGVSGGADSVALIHLLAGMQDLFGYRLHVATLDHEIRHDSHVELELVRRLANELAIPIYQRQVNVRLIAEENNIGIELAGRRARYAFFHDIATEVEATKVVTAHHLDDQAETVLMHLLRGSGLQGASGMRIVSELPGATDILLIRPLLNVPRAWLREYCQENEFEFRDDPSNQSLDWLRNRVRNQVIPLLRELVNPKVDLALARFADINTVDESFLNEIVSEQTKGHYKMINGVVYVDRATFESWHPAVQRRFIFQMLNAYFPDVEVAYEHIVHAVKVGADGVVGAVAEFSGDCRLRVDYSEFILERVSNPEKFIGDQYLLPVPGVFRVEIPGRTMFSEEGWGVCTKMGVGEQDVAVTIPTQADNLVLRSRKPGDRFVPLGMGGHSKKVKAWMIDNKIPQAVRDRVPILVYDERILAILWNKKWYRSVFTLRNDNEATMMWLLFCRE